MRKLLTLVFLTLTTVMTAQKTHYIPNEWKSPWPSDSLLYAEVDTLNEYTWSESRSRESSNIIVYWDKGYGSTAPDALPSGDTYYVDIDDLLEKCEQFYRLEADSLGFVDPVTSNISKYKIMVLVNHYNGWICNGGGYDYQAPAFWLSPQACRPVGASVAHELGHSFQYMCYSEDSDHGAVSGVETGFHSPVGSGQCIWETTANWQSLVSYPDQIFSMSGAEGIYSRSHNYAFSHEWHRYQSYPFLFFLVDYYGDIRTIAEVWNRHETSVKDFNQVLRDVKDLSVSDLYKLHFTFALHAVTWDIAAYKPYNSDNHIGNFVFNRVKTDNGAYQVAYSSAPQSTGYNVIPLKVPEGGSTLTTRLTGLPTRCALAAGDPAEYLNGNSVYEASGRTTYNYAFIKYRGFRAGYVALMNDGTRRYFARDSVYCQYDEESDSVTADLPLTVGDSVSRLWLVVAPAPRYYIQHKWNEDITDDDQWPYQVLFEGTDILGEPVIDGRAVSDATIRYDVTIAPSSDTYPAIDITLGGEALSTLGTAFQLQPSAIADMMTAWTSSGPSKGKIMFAAAKINGTLQNSGSTANGYGHWFNASGIVSAWSQGYVYSEFAPETLTFTLGQYPGKCEDGDSVTICQALRLRDSEGKTATVYFVFNITFAEGSAATLRDAGGGIPTAVPPPPAAESGGRVYDLAGRRAERSRHGVIISEGKKIYVKE